MLVLWVCAMLVLLQDVIEEDKGYLMHHSTLTEITKIRFRETSTLYNSSKRTCKLISLISAFSSSITTKEDFFSCALSC